MDLSIELDLTERVVVKPGQGGRLDIKHAAESQKTPSYDQPFWSLYAGDNLLAEWHVLEP